jgi:hypothetical protein
MVKEGRREGEKGIQRPEKEVAVRKDRNYETILA